MKKSRRRRITVKPSERRSSAKPKIHPLIQQASIPAAQLARSEFDVAAVPNPHGEVIVDGEIRRHTAVIKSTLFRTLYRRNVIDHRIYEVLRWYDQRVSATEAGLVRSALDVGCGGASHSHIPVTEASLAARDDVNWARQQIPVDLLASFDAVMRDDVSFVESARRACANRYVRVSVRTMQRRQRQAFVDAAIILTDAWHLRFGGKPGIRVATY